MTCVLCVPSAAEAVLWQDGRCRVIDAEDPDYPGYCRIIWNDHVAEMSDLAPDARAHLMDVVHAVEASLRRLLQPGKINLAALGNRVPHLHWHVIPRFPDDPHFPDAVWAPRRRAGAKRNVQREALCRELVRRLGQPA